MKRIHICGIYGSGKTTLAKRLSELLKIEYYSLDDIKYKIKYSEIRSAEERIDILKKICKKDKWITEGTWSDYARDAFKKADLIILLVPSKFICSYRTLKRYLLRDKLKNDKLLGALKLIKEVYKYHWINRPVSLTTHKSLIKKHNKKYFIIKNNSDIKNLIEILSKEKRLYCLR